MREDSKRIWTVPNVLTMVRLLLIPLYWWVMMGQGNERLALVIFVVASLTDLLDGYIARRFNQITDFGKLFDPLADKVMVRSVLLSLCLKGILPWLSLAILLVKELLMIVGSYFLLKHQLVVYAKPVGKIAQFVIVAALILSFFHASFAAFPLHLILMGLGIILTLAALVFYFISGWRALKARGLDPNQEEDNHAG